MNEFWLNKTVSEEETNFLLEQYGIPKYIEYKSSILKLFSEFPIFKKYKFENSLTHYSILSSWAINNDLNEKYVPLGMNLSSFNVNKIIHKLIEKGIDVKQDLSLTIKPISLYNKIFNFLSHKFFVFKKFFK